jgi:hypothetical protein
MTGQRIYLWRTSSAEFRSVRHEKSLSKWQRKRPIFPAGVLLTAFDGRHILSVQDRRSGPTIPPVAIGTGWACARLWGVAKNAWLSLRFFRKRWQVAVVALIAHMEAIDEDD